MFEKGDEEHSPFELCIKCAKSVIQSKIISSNKDLMAVIFYATTKEKNQGDFKNCYIVQNLDQPGADQVLQLENFLTDDPDNFAADYGHSNTFSLSDALWLCSSVFSNCTQKLGFKRIMLFTNNDCPHENQLKKQTIAKVEDLHHSGISIELMHMNKPGGEIFNYDAFYKDVLIVDDDESVHIADPAARFEELLSRVRIKEYKKRTLSRVSFSFGGALEMAVGVYNLVRTCTKPPAVKLYKKTNEEVKTVTQTFLRDTAEVLMPQDMKKMQTYATKQICFEPEEITQIKKFDDPGVKLLGFKPKSSLKKMHHVRPAQFLYPDETQIKGSTTLFTALLKKCLQRDVVAICRFTARQNQPPRIVALVPQEEELDEHQVQVAPPGFHVIFMPYADDFRNLKFEEGVPRASTEQIDKAKSIVKKLRFTFSPEGMENPSLQQHYVNVEAMALDRDQPDDINDSASPDDEMIDKRAGKMISEFSEMVFPEGYVPGAKRKAPAAARVKPDLTELNMEEEARAGRLMKLTVPILKEFVKTNRIPCAGTKKADLVQAVTDHFA
ncbi:hypothetical protein CAPTEDRAFT_158558 [Capitella teleta]|uniref:DNA helicase n=1 Tax=Capitella teleta TaxID=283909 RepID=R7V0Z7_CAPTE|nr:hypothetical protein CAPTEDRAFT_158558 [Capitella teleta]|eukprot:ELU12174.1 hypothetical protein CAPTEDRAFT_158558 [Capitella teleta]